ncbi:MAG: cob(I)yrinic acid a,c-diamide adenosyltransferase [Nanoarchaeota archaeon]|nr:cob(I)yrinic acid a,c-diamide adenosyltransferase [Nanoarchaeota archaeon]
MTSGDYNLVVLDEINVALNLGFLKLEDVLSLIKNKFEKTELVLTGRNAPKELFEVADYASDIQMIKHPFNKGVLARRGIEY